MELPPLSCHPSLEEKWDEEEEPEEIETVLKVLLPPVGVTYSLSNKESETLWAHISENVEKGFIRPISSSTGAPVLFVKKKDGGLLLCVDYHKLNVVTRKKRYPFPPMKQLLTIFNGSTMFSKIDMCGTYNLLRIKEWDKHLASFGAKYGSYDYLVMPFSLTNAPSSFQNLINDIFSDFFGIFVVVYLDDIRLFSSSEEEHFKHVVSVLQRLRENNLFSKASSVEYLGYVVSSDGLKMDSSKFQQIINWPQPKSIKALQSFVVFANFYHCFIKITLKKLLLSLPSSKKTLLLSSMRKLLVSFKYSKNPSPLLPAEL
ncbi:hypothetical protein O181_043974 [Austropuccinia psidii MF-1]|uniref:Reverse transcriptase domain-containing protein n=1 Tax=Austropuccinia psidii MF-1 TaxID=1389203 RepID=A0A9Q3DJ45_9BASI|nr:hypothetical protein [Austropuccinia psidii MF-1]